MKRASGRKNSGSTAIAVPAPDKVAGALIADLEHRLEADDPEEGFIDFVEQAMTVFPSLRRYRERLVAQLRTAAASGVMAERIAGRPHRLVVFDEERHAVTIDSPLVVLEDIAIAAEARGRVLDEPMMEAAEVSTLLGSTSTNKRQYAQRLRQQSKLVAVTVKNKDYYPLFQIDVERRRVRDVVVEVNQLLNAAEDPWGVASWWVTPNGRLDDGRAPKDLLGHERGERTAVSLARGLTEAAG
jgi:hypothetical protein